MKYSIVMPCYKQEMIIGQSLDSVLAQESCDWELLCTEDGSPDDTGKVLDEYVRTHFNEVSEYMVSQDGEEKRIVEGRRKQGGTMKVIHQKNKGMAGARNAAKRMSTGEWIINLDGDDMLSPFALKVLDECIAKCSDADMVRAGFVRFQDGVTPDWTPFDGNPKIVDCSGPIDDSMSSGAFQQLVYNRRVCGDIDIEGLNWSEERLFTARCTARITKFVVTDAGFYGYREHDQQFTCGRKMTLAECNCYLETTQTILKEFFSSKRGVSRKTLRGLILRWLEWQPRIIVERLKKSDRRVAWCHWFASLQYIDQYPKSLWMKIVVRICKLIPIVPTAIVLCYLPDWLKRKGLHR